MANFTPTHILDGSVPVMQQGRLLVRQDGRVLKPPERANTRCVKITDQVVEVGPLIRPTSFTWEQLATAFSAALKGWAQDIHGNSAELIAKGVVRLHVKKPRHDEGGGDRHYKITMPAFITINEVEVLEE
jgi:hypothetical protein